MIGTPSTGELRQLPLRAVICYVARILKRLEPDVWRIRDESSRRGIMGVIVQAEAWCRGDNIERAKIVDLVNRLYCSQRLGTITYLAGCTAWAIIQNDAGVVSTGISSIAGQLGCMASELRHDFTRLSQICGQKGGAEGPIDPSEAGPLGSIWISPPSLAIPISAWSDAATERHERIGRFVRVLASRPEEATPEVLIQATMVTLGDRTTAGQLIIDVAIPWLEIARRIERDPDFLFQFVKAPRKFEEFIAATYHKMGWPEVVLTPRSKDGGRDVIATKPGYGSIRFLEQCKAYSPGHLVTHDDVRGMLGVLQTDANASKAIITTTSDFQPGILAGDEFRRFMPHRLELKNGVDLRKWLAEILRHDDHD